MIGIEGRVAVVTGAGSGIGRASAERLAAEGATVVGVDRVAEAVEATVAALPGGADRHGTVVGDVSDPDLWARVVTAAEQRGGLAVAHLNAGVYGWRGPIDELPDDVYRATLAANIDGVVLGARAVVPALRAGGGGAIVATASVAGLVAFPPNPVYTLTKHAVVGFVRALAPALEGDGITVGAVCPGIVDTPMTVEAAGGLDLSGVPLIAPADIADAVVELVTGAGTGRCVAVLPGGRREWSFPGFEDLRG